MLINRGWLAALLMLLGGAFAEAQIPVVRFTVDRFVVEGPNPLSSEQTEAILSPYTGEHEGIEGLLDAAEALRIGIEQAGVSFNRVVLPPQELEEGVVTLQVVPLALRQLTVTQNEYFSEENIRRSLPSLRTGVVPDTRELARSLEVANENPAKEVTVKFRESSDGAALDAELSVVDSKPWQVFTLLNNTGTDETGDWRLALGAQYNNLFDSDHRVTLSYVTAPEQPADVQQIGASYVIPIYQYPSSVLLYYTTSNVDSGVVAGVDVTGSGDFWGARLTRPLRPIRSYSHRVALGVDDRLFLPDLAFESGSVSALVFGEGACTAERAIAAGIPGCTDVRSVPLSAHYSALYEGQGWQGDFGLSYVHNLDLGSDNSDAAYFNNTQRLGIGNNWDAFRFLGNAYYALPRNWLAHLVLEGQIGNEALIPGEQFGIGGAFSVRGFDERELSGDDGYRLTFELFTPPLYYGLQFLGFFDVGRVDNHIAGAGMQSETISGTGLGMRWQWKENLSLAVDVARVVEGTSLGANPRDAGSTKVHFNLFARY